MRTTTLFFKRILPALALVTLLPATSWADEVTCMQDSDCPEGYECSHPPCASTCLEGETCENQCPEEGICAEKGLGSTCETDADCPSGFSCQEAGATDCAVLCPPGETCPEPDCDSEVISACLPAECVTDADCPPELTCMTVGYSTCTNTAETPPCPPGETCTDGGVEGGSGGDGETCTDETVSFCVPPYVAPCTTDTDCGPGFTCIPATSCVCSGSGSVTPLPDDPDGTETHPDEGDEPDGTGGSPDDDCQCEETGEMMCQAEVIACASDAECPTDWTCDSITAGVCTYDVETGVEECQYEETASVCLPPYYDDWRGGSSIGGATAEQSYYDALDRATGGSEAHVNTNPPTVPPAGGGSGTDGTCRMVDDRSGAATWLLSLLLVAGFVAARRRFW